MIGALLCVAVTALNVGAVTREVTFGPGGRIAGQLDKPAGNGPFPLVILVGAGGQIDRDGTSPQFEAFRDIYLPLVDIAARAGWAIFRYDRPGSGRSRPSDRNELLDVLDAVLFACQLPDVDPRRVVLIGHASGADILQGGYEYLEQTIGFSALRGVILLSSTVRSRFARRMAGDLLIVIGESDSAAQLSAARGAVAAHRRNYGERSAEALVVGRADHALCDTTVARWAGWTGMPGSCVLPREVYDAVDRFLRNVGRQPMP
jgi:pimeloyl-ACP methyl ester carboxylesterase